MKIHHIAAGGVAGLVKFNLFYGAFGGKYSSRNSSLHVQKRKKMKAAYLVVVMGVFIGNAGAEEPPSPAATVAA